MGFEHLPYSFTPLPNVLKLQGRYRDDDIAMAEIHQVFGRETASVDIVDGNRIATEIDWDAVHNHERHMSLCQQAPTLELVGARNDHQASGAPREQGSKPHLLLLGTLIGAGNDQVKAAVTNAPLY